MSSFNTNCLPASPQAWCRNGAPVNGIGNFSRNLALEKNAALEAVLELQQELGVGTGSWIKELGTATGNSELETRTVSWY